MSSIILNDQITSKRALTFNKSFFISLVIHVFLVFGITFTTFYEIPFLKDSPIINVKFANSSQDLVGLDSKKSNSTFSKVIGDDLSSKKIQKDSFSQSYKIKRLQANSNLNNAEAVYLNLWQRKIESIGDEVISLSGKNFENKKVQIAAKIDSQGNLIDSVILISSGNTEIDNMALNILIQASPFEAFERSMLNDYDVLEIVRDWNFSTL
jgi:hypothetical protein|tara:strand:- start:1981 stop:2610 length:630 start_codon:yes stop_codon:yes gene_type:complete